MQEKANASFQELSAELLRLENGHQVGGLTPEQEKRWIAVLDEWLRLFSRENNERRRFCRFPYSAQVRVQVAGVSYSAELVEIGNFGFQLKGELADTLELKDEVLWDAVEVDGQWKTIAATCSVVSKQCPGRAGLCVSNDEPALHYRIRTVYYPAYIQALETLAAGKQLAE